MTKREFVEAVEVMVNALQTQNQDKRVSALYEFYGEERFELVKEAARLAAKELDRFPVPSVFSSFLDRCRQRGGEKQERADCSWCDGYGWAEIEGKAHRGRCEHGDSLSDKIRQAPADYHTSTRVETLSEEDMAERIAANPLRYAKGAIWLTDGKEEGHPEPMQRIVRLSRVIVGDKIWNKLLGDIRNHRQTSGKSKVIPPRLDEIAPGVGEVGSKGSRPLKSNLGAQR